MNSATIIRVIEVADSQFQSESHARDNIMALRDALAQMRIAFREGVDAPSPATARAFARCLLKIAHSIEMESSPKNPGSPLKPPGMEELID